MPYGRTNAEAGEYLKKIQAIPEKNFDNYMQRFDRHREAAEALSMDEIAVPAEDALALDLKRPNLHRAAKLSSRFMSGTSSSMISRIAGTA